MDTPILVQDLRLTLEELYDAEQLKELDAVLLGCGIKMSDSKHLEITPEDMIEQRVEELALDMADFAVLPWYLTVNTNLIISQSFYKIEVFGDVMYFYSSFYRPAAVQVSITADGVKTGGVMDKEATND